MVVDLKKLEAWNCFIETVESCNILMLMEMEKRANRTAVLSA